MGFYSDGRLRFYPHGSDSLASSNGTDAAVRDLQETYSLVVDGIVGKNTWKALVAGL
jgi:peptidoglycan hydrolase-like protein with peptidoglycan-binding domain